MFVRMRKVVCFSTEIGIIGTFYSDAKSWLNDVSLFSFLAKSLLLFKKNLSTNLQASVVEKLDSAIHRINRYPEDKYYQNQLRYPLDSNLSSG